MVGRDCQSLIDGRSRSGCRQCVCDCPARSWFWAMASGQGQSGLCWMEHCQPSGVFGALIAEIFSAIAFVNASGEASGFSNEITAPSGLRR